MASQVKFIGVTNTGRLGLKIGRWGLFLTILMLTKVISLVSFKTCPFHLSMVVRLLQVFLFLLFVLPRKTQEELT